MNLNKVFVLLYLILALAGGYILAKSVEGVIIYWNYFPYMFALPIFASIFSIVVSIFGVRRNWK